MPLQKTQPKIIPATLRVQDLFITVCPYKRHSPKLYLQRFACRTFLLPYALTKETAQNYTCNASRAGPFYYRMPLQKQAFDRQRNNVALGKLHPCGVEGQLL